MKEETIEALSWEELSEFTATTTNLSNGANNSYSLERLFGQNKSSIRVVLYRDRHAWCPYCQKIWLWLEWKKIPYSVKKANMRCYGEKEDWYVKKVPSGFFPAIEIDNKIFTESDQILFELEKSFGPLGTPIQNPQIINLRNLERELFRAWCIWLCNQSNSTNQALKRKEQFIRKAKELEEHLSQRDSTWIDPFTNNPSQSLPGSIDVIFIPFLERMNASLAYYKGLKIRKTFPNINNWFTALEKLEEYLGTQGDFHTHSHDLPPQMGGCWADQNTTQKTIANKIDIGDGLGEEETTFNPTLEHIPTGIALGRVLKHREKIKAVNPLGSNLFDQPLRAALSNMIFLNKNFIPAEGSAKGLRYLRDRISVPRDMPLLSARKLRQALERTAQIDSPSEGIPIPFTNRFDQDPAPFI